MAKAKRAQNRQAPQQARPSAPPPASIPATTLSAPAGFPVATPDAPDLPRPPMRVLAADPIPPAAMPRFAPVAAPLPERQEALPPVVPMAAARLVPALRAALHAAERAGRSCDSAVLNSVLVPLSEAIVKSQLPVIDADVRALLEKVSNL